MSGNRNWRQNAGRFRMRYLLAVVWLVSVSLTPVFAQMEERKGLEAGPWLLLPSLVLGVEYDSNPFFRSENVQSERILEATPALGIRLPFSQSLFRIDVAKKFYDYSQTILGEDTVLETSAVLELNFSSRDKLEFGAERSSGLARSTAIFDEGGEATFQGDSFDMDVFDLTLSRSVYGQRGWLLKLQRQDLVFDEGTVANFFDYRCWNYQAEYRQPVSPVSWLLFSWSGRNYDHFRVNSPFSEPFREEISQIGLVGFDARYSSHKTLRFRVGYSKNEFPGALGSAFSGIVGDIKARFQTGSRRHEFLVEALRRPHASFFANNTHFVRNSIAITLKRNFLNKSSVGLRAEYAESDYGDPLQRPLDPQNGIVRQDRTLVSELNARFALNPLMGLRLSARYSTRSSKYEGVDYDATQIFGGMAFGWF